MVIQHCLFKRWAKDSPFSDTSIQLSTKTSQLDESFSSPNAKEPYEFISPEPLSTKSKSSKKSVRFSDTPTVAEETEPTEAFYNYKVSPTSTFVDKL